MVLDVVLVTAVAVVVRSSRSIITVAAAAVVLEIALSLTLAIARSIAVAVDLCVEVTTGLLMLVRGTWRLQCCNMRGQQRQSSVPTEGTASKAAPEIKARQEANLFCACCSAKYRQSCVQGSQIPTGPKQRGPWGVRFSCFL